MFMSKRVVAAKGKERSLVVALLKQKGFKIKSIKFFHFFKYIFFVCFVYLIRLHVRERIDLLLFCFIFACLFGVWLEITL